MTQFISLRQVTALIKAVGHKRTVLVEGAAGIGKTSIHYALKADPQFAGYYAPKPIDCTQLSDGSVWMPDIDRSRGVSRELPNERFGVNDENHKGTVNAVPALICLDEIAKTRQFIKDVLAPIIYERRIGNYEMADGSVVFCCTNLTEEGLGDSMQNHLKNRLIIVKVRPSTKDEWVIWALLAGLREEIIAAAEMFPRVFDSFSDYRPGGKYAGKDQQKDNHYISNPSDASQEQVVTPRSLHAASDIVAHRAGMDDQTLEVALGGTVGVPFASEIMSMIRFGEQLPAYDRVITDPAGCPLPNNPTARIVQCFKFVTQCADKEEAEAISEYVMRMQNEMKSLFVNTIANSSLLDLFGKSATFGELLRQNRKFLAIN